MNLNELIIAYPKWSIVVIAILVTLAMTIITKYATNQERMKELKDIQKKCNITMKAHKDNPEEMAKINKEMMACSMEMMKYSFKPMLFTFIPLILLLWWIRGVYDPILPGWIWWYIVAGIASSIILRKMLKVV